ncbi:hypothetical protein PHMEG_00011512 [Phytophthora megakarya]|uniref:Chromo domain-containing protein n=1 Tax=Phytophthora megakarya TaxID=4795 RepID=A0A225WD48_9STRA|nr:hypothetical protein PHMEG_00011512 [Phytophthora megakarya]
MLIEYQLDIKEWPYQLPVVQANLNHTPAESLGGLSPIELYLSLPAPSALDVVCARVISGNVGGDIHGQASAKLHGMHKEVIDRKECKQLRAISISKGVPCNFDVSDYVLWSKVDKRLTTHKLLARWVKFYSDSWITELVSNQGLLLCVRKIKAHRFNAAVDRWELQVAWAGLEDVEDSWEPATGILKDVSGKVMNYLNSAQDDELRVVLLETEVLFISSPGQNEVERQDDDYAGVEIMGLMMH